MKKKLLHRIFATISASILCVGAAVAMTGCTTDNPEVTITYTFNGKEYQVDYVLSRKAGAQTTQHFIELADKGYYDGTVIHNYTSNALFGGGYTYDTVNKKLIEKDYFNTVKDWGLTQSVYIKDANGVYVGTNTVYGEFNSNANYQNTDQMKHEKGSLVMFYSNKGSTAERVSTIHQSDGQIYDFKEYKYNSATSLFYTCTGTVDSTADSSYCVFGKAKDYEGQLAGENGLLTAISNYRAENTAFLDTVTVYPNANDIFQSIRDDKVSATYSVPSQPIVIKSVKVNRY